MLAPWRAEGSGIDLDEGHSAGHEQPPRPPAALLALEETGAGPGEGCSTSYRVGHCCSRVPCCYCTRDRHRFCLCLSVRMDMRCMAQVATCTMHKSGALLLEASDGDALDVHLRRTGPAVGPSQTHTLLGERARPLPSLPHCGMRCCACCIAPHHLDAPGSDAHCRTHPVACRPRVQACWQPAWTTGNKPPCRRGHA